MALLREALHEPALLTPPGHSSSGTSARTEPSPDFTERTRMLAKLFLLHPTPLSQQDLVLKMAAYLDLTRDVPALILSHALFRVARRGGVFLPPVGDILREAARVTREMKRRAEGRDPTDFGPQGEPELDVERWLAQAPAVVNALRALQAGS